MKSDPMKLVVNGANGINDVPGLETVADRLDITFAPDEEHLGQHLPGAEILLGWNFRGRDLRNQWSKADQLKWVHWCGAGVDAVLFPEFSESDVVLTNARGIFDRAMAEYVLGYMLAEVKDFRKTLRLQAEKTWDFRVTEKLAGSRAVIFGVGSIGREIGKVLSAVNIEVLGVGRSRRSDDPVFKEVYALEDARSVVSDVDWVIGVMPLTENTHGVFDKTFFDAMKPSARFINVGRGQSVNQNDLEAALRADTIAGALLDVFETEPVPSDSSIWEAPNLMISPHMSGDYSRAQHDMAQQFLDNLERYSSNKPLHNAVDKSLGFAAPS